MEKPMELELLEVLEDLANEQLKYFQWFLQKEALLDGFEAIKKSQLEDADRLKTVDLMVQKYSENSLVVMRMVLKKITSNEGRRVSSC
eukprot:superscaffoldBa00008422_g23336